MIEIAKDLATFLASNVDGFTLVDDNGNNGNIYWGTVPSNAPSKSIFVIPVSARIRLTVLYTVNVVIYVRGIGSLSNASDILFLLETRRGTYAIPPPIVGEYSSISLIRPGKGIFKEMDNVFGIDLMVRAKKHSRVS